MVREVVAFLTADSNPNPCRRIQKVRRTPLRTLERVYRTIAFDVLQHGKFTCHVLRELSNSCCLPGRAGGSPNGLVRSRRRPALRRTIVVQGNGEPDGNRVVDLALDRQDRTEGCGKVRDYRASSVAASNASASRGLRFPCATMSSNTWLRRRRAFSG